MSNHLCITLQNYFHFILTLTTYKRRGGDSSTDFLLIKRWHDLWLEQAFLCDVPTPLWLVTFKSAHTFASVLLDYHIFFFLHIYDILAKLLQQAYLDRQVTAHTIDPGARSCIDAFDELLQGRKRKKNPCCWCRLLGCSPTCGPYVSSPVVTSSARGSS